MPMGGVTLSLPSGQSAGKSMFPPTRDCPATCREMAKAHRVPDSCKSRGKLRIRAEAAHSTGQGPHCKAGRGLHCLSSCFMFSGRRKNRACDSCNDGDQELHCGSGRPSCGKTTLL